ncbi:NACHT, LRR and PYD domains-containing protein 1b allele 2 isoform X2 [Xenopus laevis]|uniref:NACHT, LRR and PYD domains-containing protein 1b allele 2 isoform X2 n=1 Tax=Xenopus laevis TaxID=8355 RepID=A0A8J1LTZ3_XENLA|nr:NACHT, LRR and PYD domains-containing protein 1b allele 2 isoform X2 [Xenopus laevis]
MFCCWKKKKRRRSFRKAIAGSFEVTYSTPSPPAEEQPELVCSTRRRILSEETDSDTDYEGTSDNEDYESLKWGLGASIRFEEWTTSLFEEGASGGMEEGAAGGMEEGAAGGMEEGAAGGKEEGANGGMEEGAAGGMEEGAAGGMEEGAAGGMEEGAAGGMEEGAAGGMEEGAAGGMEEGAAGGMEKVATGGIKEAATGGIKEAATGGIKEATRRFKKGATSGLEAGAAGGIKEATRRFKKGATSGLEAGAAGGLVEELIEQVEKPCYWPRGRAMECQFCGMVPDVIDVHVRKNGDSYRLELPYKGRFCCSETGIQFCVESPTSIEFELSSWDDYLIHLQKYSCDIVSPLFNITIKHGEVLAVYLPHYVCLRGVHIDTKRFKVAHYKDDNMVLETPSEVLPFYVVLKQPTFSPVGVIMIRTLPGIFRKRIPTHGAVFIYSRYITGCTLHLYFMPQDPSLLKELHKKENENGFSWVSKPPQTNTVYSRRRYIVGGPKTVRINPKDLKLRFNGNPMMYPYSEIYLLDVSDEIPLTLTCRESQKAIWDALLRRDLGSRLGSVSNKASDGQHFVDRHCKVLIARTSHMDPVLDDLLTCNILSQEQYDCVRSKGTSQEKMRQLYDCVRSWGQPEKDELYQSLKIHNRALIRDLECN